MTVIFEQILIAKEISLIRVYFFYYAQSLGRGSWCYQGIKYFHFQNRRSWEIRQEAPLLYHTHSCNSEILQSTQSNTMFKTQKYICITPLQNNKILGWQLFQSYCYVHVTIYHLIIFGTCLDTHFKNSECLPHCSYNKQKCCTMHKITSTWFSRLRLQWLGKTSWYGIN